MADRRISWRPRFSLRTLAIVVTLSALIAGWLTQSALRQRQAVAELTKLGADVLYEHKVSQQSTSWIPEWLRHRLGIDFFAEATEVQFGFQYGWAEQSAQNKAIRSQVILSERSLYLCHLPITDAGLAHLRGATAMQVLVLPGTTITDSGLIHLSGMSELSSLDLSFTAISDESIDQLLCFKKLGSLRLLGTRITQQGADRLRQAFPAVSIALSDVANAAP